MRYVLGVDLGTSSIKIILVNEMGKTIDVVQKEYGIISLQRGYSEQDPNSWIEGFNYCFKQILEKNKDIVNQIEAISFSGQMHSMVLLDKDNKPIRNAILWNDVRTKKECEFLNKNYSNELKNEALNIALEGFTLPKLLWVKEFEPDNFKKISCIMMPKDFLIFYLTNTLQTESTDAAGTLMLKVNENKWNYDLMDKLGIKKEILPTLNSPTSLVGSIKAELNLKFNLTHNINVYSGAADNVCGAIGSGLIDDKKALLSIGTSGVFVKLANSSNHFDGQLHYFNYLNNLKYCMGVTLGAGISLKWFKEKILKLNLSYDALLAKIKDLKLSINDPIFTPWLFGERTPYLDGNIRASFVNIDINHKDTHLLKAVLEGVVYSLKTCKDIYEIKTQTVVNSIISTGGGSINKIWLQIQADILNTTIETIDNLQGPAYGAAMIACVGQNIINSFEDCIKKWVNVLSVTKPNNENVKIYQQLYNKYKKLYDKLSDL